MRRDFFLPMERKKNHKYSFSQIITKFSQFIYLSVQGSTNNNIWESASACSFNFIFSFIPVVMIILTALVTVLRFSPDLLQYVMGFCKQVESIYDFWPLLENLLNKKSISFFDFILAIWVIWMARKLFLSIVKGINFIFRTENKRKNAFNQLLTFISEFALVIVFIIFIIGTFLFNKLLNLPMFDFLRSNFPFIFRTLYNVLASSVMYFMFFVFSLLSYKFISGTNPPLKICLFYAFLNTGITFVISFFLNRFMNLTNYNVIYGTISTVIVLLFKVYLFFSIFLFCAQMVYVSQFFDNLIISQVYVIQHKKRTYIENLLCNYLFNRPSVSNLKTKSVFYQSGDIIYKEGDDSQYVYYIKNGNVTETTGNSTITYENSCFFGEITGFLNTTRTSTATADTYTEVIKINTPSFIKIINQDHLASTVALTKLSQYTKSEDTISD